MAFRNARGWTFITKQYSSLSTCSCKDILGTNKGTVYSTSALLLTLFHSSHLISCSHRPPFYHLFFLLPFSWHLFSPAYLFPTLPLVLFSLLSLLAECELPLLVNAKHFLHIYYLRQVFQRWDKNSWFQPIGCCLLKQYKRPEIVSQTQCKNKNTRINYKQKINKELIPGGKNLFFEAVTSDIVSSNVH